MSSEEQQKLEYVKSKGVHHLFELLASKVLISRPDNIFSFLREELTRIEEEERRPHHAHDPSQVFVPAALENKMPQGNLKVTIAVLGLDNAGKTALIAAMGGSPDPNTTPTVGYSPSMFTTDKYEICVFDLGGGKNFRGIWTHYYHDLHGVVYVVDSADTARLQESADVFKDLIAHPRVEGKPLLVFANKSDAASGKAIDIVKQKLNIDAVKTAEKKVLASCAIRDDPAIEEGIEWLMNAIATRYSELAALVKAQTEEMKLEKRKRLEEQRRRVEELRREEGRTE
jgi:Arf/Sar family protein